MPNRKIENMPQLTTHAVKRAQQRGISRAAQAVVWEFGDREVSAGGGCMRLSISSASLRLLIQSGAIHPRLAERCARLVLLTDGSTVICAGR